MPHNPGTLPTAPVTNGDKAFISPKWNVWPFAKA